MNKWHTKSVSIKVAIIHTLNFLCILCISVWSAYSIWGGVDKQQKQSYANKAMASMYESFSKHMITISITTMGITIILFIKPPKWMLDRILIYRTFTLLIFWMQFLRFYIVKPDKNHILIGILGFAVQSFCAAESSRICGLYNNFLLPEFKYFKFIMAASICTAYYSFGFGSTYFWVVLSTFVSLTFFNGNYFKPSDANYDCTGSTTYEEHHPSFLCRFSDRILNVFVHHPVAKRININDGTTA